MYYDGFTRVFWRNNADPRKQYLGPKILTKGKRYYYERIEGIVYKKTDLKMGCMPPTYRNQVLDRTKVLHDPRTQTYRETNYLKN